MKNEKELMALEVVFKKQNLLGSGSYGSIYEGKYIGGAQKELFVAVKRYNSNSLQSAGGWSKDALRETVALFSIRQHPNVLKPLFAFMDSKMRPHIVMEKLTMNMYEYLKLRKKPLEVKQVINFGLQLCEAVNHLHEHKIIHRDIKLENILLFIKKDEITRVVLSDLGMARFVGTESTKPRYTGNVCSLLTKAPELLPRVGTPNETPNYDEKIDSWSLGCVLLCIMVGSYSIRIKNSDGFYNSQETVKIATSCLNDLFSRHKDDSLPSYKLLQKNDINSLENLKIVLNKPDVPLQFVYIIATLLNPIPQLRNSPKIASDLIKNLLLDFCGSNNEYVGNETVLQENDEFLSINNSVVNFSADKFSIISKVSNCKSINIASKKHISKWIWNTICNLGGHELTRLFALIIWLSSWSENCCDALLAASSCSLACKLMEKNEGNISFWAKSVGEKVSKIIEAEHKILQELKGGLYNLMEQNNIMDNFQNNDQIKIQYSILSLTDNNKEMTILSSLGCFGNSEMESTRKEFIKHLH